MTQLFIKCPSTGENIPTGMYVEQETDFSSITGNNVDCSICDEIHVWNGNQAFLVE